jgi:A/G-specific adenine glycosylase
MKPLTEALLDWYAASGRDLPWRRTRDPYAIWVSEIMLQQTQVESVIPYYQRWMTRFPTIEALAHAPIDDVLNLWEGLGYYRRAHGLHKAARQLHAAGDAHLPETPKELESLPGIGRYTARAVAAIAFDADVLALDGNLRRVLARLFDVALDVSGPEGEKRLRALGESILPRGKASAFNQALMDLGAAVCTPRTPRCSDCPVSDWCAAYNAGVQEQRPVRKARAIKRHREGVRVVAQRDGQVLIGRRPADGLLGGLWGFPGQWLDGEVSASGAAERFVREELALGLVVVQSLGSVEHAYTHFSVTVHAFACDVSGGEPVLDSLDDLQWVPPDRLSDFAMGKVDRTIGERLAGG